MLEKNSRLDNWLRSGLNSSINKTTHHVRFKCVCVSVFVCCVWLEKKKWYKISECLLILSALYVLCSPSSQTYHTQLWHTVSHPEAWLHRAHNWLTDIKLMQSEKMTDKCHSRNWQASDTFTVIEKKRDVKHCCQSRALVMKSLSGARYIYSYI